MIALLLLWLAPAAAILLLLLVLRVRSKKLLIGLPFGALLLPLLLLVGIYMARVPIQQGKVMGELGPLLNLLFPAEDLYIPLAEEQLQAGRTTYDFDVSHKYVGNHAVEVYVRSSSRPQWSAERRLKIQVSYFRGGQAIKNMEETEGSPFMGMDQYGYIYSSYRAPLDVPVGVMLYARVSIQGDLEAFLEEHAGAMLAVKKLSDK